MTEHHPVVVVGSGLAGLAAAALLSTHGVGVLVIDDNAHPGGQLLRSPPCASGRRGRFTPDRLKRRGFQLVQRIQNTRVRFLQRTQVLGLYPERTLLVEHGGHSVSEYRADALILATGARERHLPFTGWTLPGVMATGAAQILMKGSGVLPGKKPLIGGLGPLMLVVAAEILANGGRVRALLDQSTFAAKLDAVTAGPAIGPKLLEGAFHMARLAAARVPVRQGVRILEARGRRQLETVVYAHTDAGGKSIPGTERVCATDALAVGYGFSPNIELPQQAGCAVSHDPGRGGWTVDVDGSMATSEPGIYAVGETTGIAGAGKSFMEGQIAAWDILLKQGRADRRRCADRMEFLNRQRRQQLRYGRFLNHLCRIPPGCYAEIPDETVICRCEEITMGEIRRQIAHGFDTLNGIKRATRCTMGNCQGRTCGPILSDIIGAFTGQPQASIGCASARAPIKPVALGALAKMANFAGIDGDDQESDPLKPEYRLKRTTTNKNPLVLTSFRNE